MITKDIFKSFMDSKQNNKICGISQLFNAFGIGETIELYVFGKVRDYENDIEIMECSPAVMNKLNKMAASYIKDGMIHAKNKIAGLDLWDYIKTYKWADAVNHTDIILAIAIDQYKQNNIVIDYDSITVYNSI